MKWSSWRSLLGVYSITLYAWYAKPNTTHTLGLQLHKRSASDDLVMALFSRFATTEPTCRWSCCMVDRKHGESKWARTKKGGGHPSIFLVEHLKGTKQAHFLQCAAKRIPSGFDCERRYWSLLDGQQQNFLSPRRVSPCFPATICAAEGVLCCLGCLLLCLSSLLGLLAGEMPGSC
jgi:hypothetical protein